MNYNDLAWDVRLSAPCNVLVTSPAEMPKKCPSETLMLVVGMRFIAAYIGDEYINVSSEEASELIKIAHEPKLEGVLMSEIVDEIKVGDKVRVVQIIARNDGYGHHERRLKHLGKVGIVRSTRSRYPRHCSVLLSGDAYSSMFYGEELKVLSVPCEQPKSDDLIGSLRMQITKLLAENARLGNECKRLSNQNGALHKNVINFMERNTELVEANALLGTRLAEQQERREVSLRANEKVRAEIINIVNNGMDVW